MLSLYKRGRIWWLRGSVNGIKVRESTRVRDQKAAEVCRRRRERELSDPVHAAAHQATVASACVRFLRELKLEGKAAGTVNMYECKAGHVCRILGGIRLSQLSRADVLRFIEQRQEETASSHTIHRELTALRRALRSAMAAKEFTVDPKAVLPRFASGYVPRTRWLSEDELAAVMSHLEPARAAVVAFAVATAADYRSLFVAQRCDVQASMILVRGTKTSSRLRTVPRVTVFAHLVDFALKHGDGEGGLLFAPWENMPRDLARACKRAGVEPFTARDLRRTTGTWLLKRGVPINIAAKFMGHANTLMLQRVYGQLDAGDVGRLIEAQTAVPVAYPLMTSGAERKDGKDAESHAAREGKDHAGD